MGVGYERVLAAAVVIARIGSIRFHSKGRVGPRVIAHMALAVIVIIVVVIIVMIVIMISITLVLIPFVMGIKERIGIVAIVIVFVAREGMIVAVGFVGALGVVVIIRIATSLVGCGLRKTRITVDLLLGDHRAGIRSRIYPFLRRTMLAVLVRGFELGIGGNGI